MNQRVRHLTDNTQWTRTDSFSSSSAGDWTQGLVLTGKYQASERYPSPGSKI